jgi:predicted transcriptional regulator
MAKVTFTVDEATVRTLRATAERLGKPQSMIVREAVAEYGARVGRLTEAERRRMLAAIDQMTKRPATRPKADVAQELREIRRARRDGGRRHRAE